MLKNRGQNSTMLEKRGVNILHPTPKVEVKILKFYIGWKRGVKRTEPTRYPKYSEHPLWTKDYNGFCDVSCGPLQRLAWLKAVSHNGTSSRPSSDVAGKSFRENYFKIGYLFYLQNQYRGPMMPAKLLYKLLRKKVRDMDMNLVLWIWSTRTRTKVLVLVLTHFVSTRTRTHAKQSTRTQDLCTRPNPAYIPGPRMPPIRYDDVLPIYTASINCCKRTFYCNDN